MYVTEHAFARMVDRMGNARAQELANTLSTLNGERDTVAYIMGNLHEPVMADDGSNGDTMVAVAVDGSVETVYFRRSSQDLSAPYFGARKVVDMRADTLRSRIVTEGMDSDEYRLAYEQSKRDTEALDRAAWERGETIDGRRLTAQHNVRSAANRGAQQRRLRRRKAGAQ